MKTHVPHIFVKVRDADGTVDIRTNLDTNKCLDVNNFSTSNGTPVWLWDCNGGLNQRWSPVGPYSCGTGIWCQYRNVYSRKCLDVYNYSMDNGAGVLQWDCKPAWDGRPNPYAISSGEAPSDGSSSVSVS